MKVFANKREGLYSGGMIIVAPILLKRHKTSYWKHSLTR